MAHRYAAFISYSHRDAAFARWLHRAIESYSPPRTLIGRATPDGPVPKRITPLFRDRDELSASASLSAAIEEALASSARLIVLGSPAAARSRWVNAEVLQYKRRHGEGRVIAAIVDGEPDSGGEDECFPPALRFALGPDGELSGTPAEPVAADFRPEGDGKRLGLLKIVAGLIGVGLDELVQREAHRRNRRLGLAAGASLAGMAVTSGLAVAAVQARDAAERQRGQAEGLVEFMLTDLRGRLEPVGRLDALDVVGERALRFYASQPTGDLDSDSLGRRSRALHLIGEVSMLRGDLPRAQRIFVQSAASTAEQMRRDPDDPQRIFDHAQSVFWVGNTAWERGDLPTAERAFTRYRFLADRLVAVGGEKPDWLAEIDYANSNLGTVLMDRGRFEDARAAFGRSLAVSERLLKAEPGSRERMMSLAQSLAWLADAEAQSGRLAAARDWRHREIAVYARLLKADPRDVGATRSLAHAETALARFALLGVPGDDATRLARKASGRIENAVVTDPANAAIRRDAISPLLVQAGAALSRGDRDGARPPLRLAGEHFDRLRQIDSAPTAWADVFLDLTVTRARLAIADRELEQALHMLRSAESARSGRRATCNPRRTFPRLLQVGMFEGDAHAMLSRAEAARDAWQRTAARARECGALEPEALAAYGGVLKRLGAHVDALAAEQKLRDATRMR